jgi:hypothetical protein
MDYPEYLDAVINRIDPTFGKTIDCEQGWWQIVADCANELESIDQDYVIYQVKEKFGTLRFYFRASDPSLEHKMNKVVSKFEKIASQTCERTGKEGKLLRHQTTRVYKTLNERYISSGWDLVEHDYLQVSK